MVQGRGEGPAAVRSGKGCGFRIRVCLLSSEKEPAEREKLHGCIDVGLSVMSVKKSSKCIDLDTEEHIYHLKVKSEEIFDEWVSKLRHHRMYRQNEIAMFPHEVNHFFSGSTVTDSAPGVFDTISSRKVIHVLPIINVKERGGFLDLAHCHAYLVEMSQLLQSMDVLHRTYSAPAINAIQVPKPFSGPVRLHSSNPNLSTLDFGEEKNYSDGSETSSEFSKIQEDLCHIAHKVYFTLRSAFNTMSAEREKLKQLMEQEVSASPSAQVIGLKHALSSALAQNTDLKERLRRIHAESLLLDPPAVAKSGDNLAEISDDDSYVSDISDNLSLDNLSNDLDNERQTLGPVLERGEEAKSKRRTCLPAPGPNTSNISLWNILRNNIGKDLSKVAMPVELNEPLNTLQRLCEELEYSELLDKAAQIPNSLERMVYVAAFAISAYASSYFRAGSKPFNPVLGETYECIREDKGFRFFSEQVGRGSSSFGDHFEWNKVTSCIHNILSGQRWIEHYGEIVIKNLNDDSCHCKVNFIKAKYWSTNAHEIEGTVFDRSGKAVHRLFGKWHESIYCGGASSSICVWRANPMPKGFEQYYGFTQFALELNELDSSSRSLLPPTDTRFRPDQRFLEEGNLEEAEIHKQRIEQLQRERRRVLEENRVEHQPRFFRSTWVMDGPKLVRELFQVAEEHAPSIVFTDEIDVIGTKRYDSNSGGEREIQQTMLELLNQLDGFDSRGDVKVVMATHLIETLDPVLIRPGCIDRKIEFPLPDEKTKERIFQIHTSRMTLADDVTLDDLMMAKDDLSGADVKAVCTEAGLMALRVYGE
ncbi:Oxysterol-binding protein-related protein 3 [Tupaia chinensis]|uniref:Oxysterol-binding protein-related protein 3 n=1 Tax=Tupaia chinensis TaxID=246437 RepID=L8YF52_TUPCH|nr:Oxysterol-binding protein-related protein 3 [Tupaia chinensis]